MEGEEIHIDPALQAKLPSDVIVRSEATKQSQGTVPERHIQELLGHKSSKITEIYTHVSNKVLMKIQNPLDQIFKEKGGANL